MKFHINHIKNPDKSIFTSQHNQYFLIEMSPRFQRYLLYRLTFSKVLKSDLIKSFDSLIGVNRHFLIWPEMFS